MHMKVDFYDYKDVITDTKQNWLNLLGYKQFCVLILKGELKNLRLNKKREFKNDDR